MVMLKQKLRFRRRPLLRQNAVDEERVPSPPPVKIEPITRFDEIIKSHQDSKNYRGLILENGMKVFLISDPTTDKSAACMCVEVGHMADPPDIPGLAHLVEHVLFLGTEKFPNENDFRSFISENGGFTNAQTFADVTKYFFDVVPDKLCDALERFSQMFTAPLFNESSVVREISAVNSEHEKNLASDAWRIRMVNKTLANPNHAYSKFSTGNKTTLIDKPARYGIDVRNELVIFHDKWYRSGNLMNLAVVGKNSLDELEEFVKIHFMSSIVNKNVEYPAWGNEVFTADQVMTKTFVTPVMDVRTMTLSFQTPDLFSYYKSSVSFEVSLVLASDKSEHVG